MADRKGSGDKNRYTRILERIFGDKYEAGKREVVFSRDEIVEVSSKLGLERPKNIGDLLYTFRYRSVLPLSIRSLAPKGETWVIRSRGKSRYALELTKNLEIRPRVGLSVIKVPDATPGVIAMHALNDEQALLARIRYNRLVDIFTRVTCYSLQSHLRTSVVGLGQVETDEVYVGIDRQGAQYVMPVQAKRRGDQHNVVQIEADLAMCRARFPELIPRALGAQFLEDETIALFAFDEGPEGITLNEERHYRLVESSALTPAELAGYRRAAGKTTTAEPEGFSDVVV